MAAEMRGSLQASAGNTMLEGVFFLWGIFLSSSFILHLRLANEVGLRKFRPGEIRQEISEITVREKG